jgi:hypothetical protein
MACTGQQIGAGVLSYLFCEIGFYTAPGHTLRDFPIFRGQEKERDMGY